MFDILGLGVVFYGYFRWFFIMVVHTFDVPLFPLLGFILDLHINLDGEWRYLDDLGVWITIAPGSGVQEEVRSEE